MTTINRTQARQDARVRRFADQVCKVLRKPPTKEWRRRIETALAECVLNFDPTLATDFEAGDPLIINGAFRQAAEDFAARITRPLSFGEELVMWCENMNDAVQFSESDDGVFVFGPIVGDAFEVIFAVNRCRKLVRFLPAGETERRVLARYLQKRFGAEVDFFAGPPDAFEEAKRRIVLH
jgi:hypothetical protein